MPTDTELLDAESEATDDTSVHVPCERCERDIRIDDGEYCQVVVAFTGNRWVRGTAASVEVWCDYCAGAHSVDIQDSNDIPAMRAAGVDRVSYALAMDSFYEHSDGYWYAEPEPEPDEDEDEDDTCLLSYGTDVIDVLGWPSNSNKRGLLFGVELEMEAKRPARSSNLVALLGGSRGTRRDCAILKSDGSLEDGRGAELVTLPYSLEYHQQSGMWQDLLDSRLQAIAKSGVGTDNCGIHVHVNRRALSALTIGKMVVFLNNPENSAFVTTVAQRRSGHYCKRDERKKHASHVTESDGVFNSRYDIINVTGGATVEIRMFKGNLRPERVLKNVEFCHALVRFCEQTGIVEAQRWGEFCNWLKKQRKTYPHLFGFLAEKEYFPMPRTYNAARVEA